MANLKFFTKGTGETSTIYVRFYDGRKFDYKRKTSLLINPKYFNNKKGEVRQVAEYDGKIEMQDKLSDLKNHIEKSYNNDYVKGVNITGDWLSTQIDNFFERKEDTNLNYLYDYALHYANGYLKTKVQKDGSIGASFRTIQKHLTIANKIKEFEKYKKGKRYLLSEVNMKFHGDIIQFLHNVQKLNLKTTGRYITFIKTICKHAESAGYKVHIDLKNKDFKPTDEKTTFITLDEAEIEKIFNHNLRLQPYLDNAKDWLILGVWIGARGGDLLNLKAENIKDGYIEYIAEKTKKTTLVPLHWQVEAIIKKHNGNFPRKISTQKFNDYIKLVCKEVGLDEVVKGAKIDEETKRKKKGMYPKYELVTSHVCRRSFATNHYGKLPTPVLMSITQHSTEKMFLNYIGETSKDNAKILKEYWQKLRQTQTKESKLEVIRKAK